MTYAKQASPALKLAAPAVVLPMADTKALMADSSIRRLIYMMEYRRPDGTAAEESFIRRFIRPLEPLEDKAGNLWIQVGEAPAIMWSVHTDTVHHKPGRQKVYVDAWGHARVVRGSGNCLGADDTAGVWLALEMITAGVEGLYVFHRGEECGGIGSQYVAKHTPERLEGLRFAIALDRKGYSSVITHQGGRCCSDAFANSLASALGIVHGGVFAADDSGIFTDTANYVGLVGECTNLSVGYFNQHGPKESLDLQFVKALRDRLITADFSALVYEREPGEIDEDSLYSRWSGWGGDGFGDDILDDDASRYKLGSYSKTSGYSRSNRKCYDVADVVYYHSRAVADLLEGHGLDVDSLCDALGIEPD